MSQKSLETGHLQVLALPEGAELAPSWVAEVGRERKDEKTASTEAVGSIIIHGSQEPKTETLGIQVYS